MTSGPSSGESIALDREIVIGREGADLTINDPEMSRRHAAVRPVGEGVEIEDLGSTNGTFVNGERISGAQRLTASGTVRVGNSQIEVEVPQAVAEPAVTRARDVPVAEPAVTKARDVPVAEPAVTKARDVPVAEPDVTAPRRVEPTPVEPPSQPTVARAGRAAAPAAEDDPESERALAKAGLVAVVITAIIGLPGAFHPQPEPGDDNPRAFLETIIPSDTWTPLHLAYLTGITASVAFFLVLYRSLSRGPGAYWARLGYAFAIVSVAVGGIWMMLDGVAMKEIADDAAAATGAEKVAVEQAAFAIEHFILALFSFHIMIWAGVTNILYGLAILRDGRWPAALGPAGVALGAFAFVLGLIQLFTERTALVTHVLVPIMYIVFTIWLVATAVLWWRRAKTS